MGRLKLKPAQGSSKGDEARLGTKHAMRGVTRAHQTKAFACVGKGFVQIAR